MVPEKCLVRITVLGDMAYPIPPTAELGAVSTLKAVGGLVDAILKGTMEDTVGAYNEEMGRCGGWVLRLGTEVG